MLMKQIRYLWRNLPIQTLEALLDGRSPLVMAPHPDDESLGCGGLLAQCTTAGITAQVAILTDGSRSHPGSSAFPPARLAERRREEAVSALGKLGLPPQSLHWLGIEDTRLSATGPLAEDVIARLATISARTGSTLILAPWRHDPHCDHEAAAIIAETLGRRLDYPVLSYPVWGWTLPDEREILAPVTGFRLNVAAESERKQRAIRAHETQYGGLVDDAPDGFTLPAGLLGVFARPYETFLLA